MSPCLRSEQIALSARVTARQKPARSAGFTLLELLVVVTMMVFITTIMVMNYFGAMRSAGTVAVNNNVFNALLMARQRACLDNKPVYFYLIDTTNYVLQESFGTLARVDTSDASYPGVSGSIVLYDQYAQSPDFPSNTVLVDIDAPGTGAIVWLPASPTISIAGVDSSGNTNATYAVSFCALHVTNNPSCASWTLQPWLQGHRYGTQIFAPQMLPKGFFFTQGAGASVEFLPDGTVNLSNLPTPPLTVQEKISGKQATFTIYTNGKITQGNGSGG